MAALLENIIRGTRYVGIIMTAKLKLSSPD